MGACTFYGYMYGHPDKLISPIGGDGNICGVSEGYEEYPYLFIGEISEAVFHGATIFDYGVCV